MKIIVDKLYQSPTTPVISLGYTVIIEDYDIISNSDEEAGIVNLIEMLENLVIHNLFGEQKDNSKDILFEKLRKTYYEHHMDEFYEKMRNKSN
jgi:hypothetical protein